MGDSPTRRAAPDALGPSPPRSAHRRRAGRARRLAAGPGVSIGPGIVAAKAAARQRSEHQRAAAGGADEDADQGSDYCLLAGDNLRHAALPFPEARNQFERLFRGQQEMSAMVFRWSEGRIQNHTTIYGKSIADGVPLSSLIEALLVQGQFVDGPAGLVDAPIVGDWVVRNESSPAERIKDFNAILKDELHVPIQLALRSVERTVYVAKGAYKFTPRPAEPGQPAARRRAGNADLIDVFAVETTPGAGSETTGQYFLFLNRLGTWIGAHGLVRSSTASQSRWPGPSTPGSRRPTRRGLKITIPCWCCPTFPIRLGSNSSSSTVASRSCSWRTRRFAERGESLVRSP